MLTKIRQARSVIKAREVKSNPITIKSIQEEAKDAQLAVALKTMQAKITNGKFIKVGKGTAALQKDAEKQQALKERRAALLKQIAEIDKKLGRAKP